MQAIYNIYIDNEEIENVGNLSWGDDIETIASEFSFDSPDSFWFCVFLYKLYREFTKLNMPNLSKIDSFKNK